jgi:hypothetical protein
MQEPYKSSLGIWIYPSLPPGMKVATKEDFLEKNGQLILGKDFLVKSFHFDRYEAHITTLNFLDKWDLWLKENNIYVR